MTCVNAISKYNTQKLFMQGMAFYSDREGAVESKSFKQLLRNENILHFLVGKSGKSQRKATVIERLIKTLRGMLRLTNSKSLSEYKDALTESIQIYNNTWYCARRIEGGADNLFVERHCHLPILSFLVLCTCMPYT